MIENNYQNYIGKQAFINKEDKEILIIKSVIKHPFKNKLAYKFTNNRIVSCEDCTIYDLDLNLKKQENFKKYIGKTIYYSAELFKNYLSSEVKPEINNLFRVKDILIKENINTVCFIFENEDIILPCENFKLFKNDNFHYYDFENYKKIDKEEWYEMFDTFQKISDDLLCYKADNGHILKGFSCSNFFNKKTYLIPISFNTDNNKFSISLLKKYNKNIFTIHGKNKIIDRSFFFFIHNKIFEFINKETLLSLNNLSNEIEWTIKNYNLYNNLQIMTKNKNKEKTKIIKI